jgi:hypothetical protein
MNKKFILFHSIKIGCSTSVTNNTLRSGNQTFGRGATTTSMDLIPQESAGMCVV